MKTQMMIRKKLQPFRFSGRAICFFFIITSIFHSGQSLTLDNPAVYIKKGTVITDNSKQADKPVKTNRINISKITFAGKGYLYIKEGTVVYGVQSAEADKIAKKTGSSSSQHKTTQKEISRKKVTKDDLRAFSQKITTQPDRNNLYAASLSGQPVCVAPGSHYQNFIFYHTIRYISAVLHEEYIVINYHYRYSVFSKNIIDGGGIRPPPFHC